MRAAHAVRGGCACHCSFDRWGPLHSAQLRSAQLRSARLTWQPCCCRSLNCSLLLGNEGGPGRAVPHFTNMLLLSPHAPALAPRHEGGLAALDPPPLAPMLLPSPEPPLLLRHEGGLAALYRGVWPTTVRAAILTASQLPVYDHSKHWLLSNPATAGRVKASWAGRWGVASVSRQCVWLAAGMCGWLPNEPGAGRCHKQQSCC